LKLIKNNHIVLLKMDIQNILNYVILLECQDLKKLAAILSGSNKI
jgi:hypothetical protein